MKLILATIILGLTVTLNAQTIPVNFDDCEYEMFFVTADESPKWNNNDTTIFDYLNKELKDYKELKKANGKIILGILIYENGKTCCHSFTNMTDKELSPEKFKKIVNNMPDWKPGKQKDSPVIFLYHAVLNVRKGKIENK